MGEAHENCHENAYVISTARWPGGKASTAASQKSAPL
jgi:hypothetical protein